MDDGPLWPWLITGFLIIFANFLAVSETALASCSRVRMKTMEEKGNKKAAMVMEALTHFDRTISAILILTNISHIAASALVTVAVTRIKTWGLDAVPAATFVMTLVLFFFAEMLPKSFAKKYANRLALVCAGPLRVMERILRPFTSALAAIGAFASRFVGSDPEASVTEDEIHDIIDDLTEEGALNEEQGDLISSALQFNDVTVESVLTPRVDVDAVDIDDDPDDILNQIREQTHSRLPVYEGSIDNIIGVLRIRRYLRAFIQNRSEGVSPATPNIRKLLDEPLYVTETAKLDELLPRMSRERQSLAIVTDHYGGTVGIVTMEDILEALVGEIWDEEDVIEEPVIDLKNGSFLVDAEETVSDTFEQIGFEDPEDDEELVNTRLGEWVFEHFSTVPKVREHFEYHGLRVYVARMEHNRIRKVMLRLPSEPEKKAREGGEEA